MQKFGSPNRISTFLKEISSIYDTLVQFYGKPYFEQNQIGDNFYVAYWLTEGLKLIELNYSNKNLTLDIKQYYKLKGWKRVWNQIKINFKRIFTK